ncbi:hypothetical protein METBISCDRAFT_13406 [Metschnikowia bicuspidata]|uniref:Aminopeptidase P N-terminal domain-containing protein n=1 Tax=Metschnikowia bicuspidata TaxID=27322 RepID=A0A4P9ZFF8_9ASCO|nr:hypothetical protein METBISCDRAFT_13406 [Metschnikowia bicuspidata]
MSALTAFEGKKYPAKEHAQRVHTHYSQQQSSARAAFFISGELLELYQYSDQTRPWRQNRYFFYLSGCDIPSCHVLYVPETDRLTLFLPDFDVDDVMWSGLPLSREKALLKYDVDDVKYAADLEATLKEMHGKVGTVLTTEINKWNAVVARFLTEKDDAFFLALDECRMIKDAYEIALMKHAAHITDNCHLAVMSAVPIETNETHIHAEFIYHALRQKAKHLLYDPICCAGPNCSTLHYVKNDDDIGATKRSVLIDAGAEWSCYASDVTRCFPINGDWTKEHLEIYNIVLKMQKLAMAMIRPGALWDAIHLETHRVLIREFVKLGIFKDCGEDTIFELNISVGFFPHGLGHLLGMDTHDVGGRPNYEDPDPKLRYLRLRRPLQAGMVLTDEPGVYFSPFLLKEILKDPKKLQYINTEVLDKYYYVGGVRIEDDLLITEAGFENFTKITSDPEEISKIMRAAMQKGRSSFQNVF